MSKSPSEGTTIATSIPKSTSDQETHPNLHTPLPTFSFALDHESTEPSQISTSTRIACRFQIQYPRVLANAPTQTTFLLFTQLLGASDTVKVFAAACGADLFRAKCKWYFEATSHNCTRSPLSENHSVSEVPKFNEAKFIVRGGGGVTRRQHCDGNLRRIRSGGEKGL